MKMDKKQSQQPQSVDGTEGRKSEDHAPTDRKPREIGGRNGPEPTRFGDWEKGGRCVDF